jgi:hypothetical protein
MRNNSKYQHWEKLYRAAVLESDRDKLPQRIEAAEAAILERSRGLSISPGNHIKERRVITRALHMLRLLRGTGPSIRSMYSMDRFGVVDAS